MVIVVAGGKGGTGKTMVAVSLALAAAGTSGPKPLLLDCDVEEPNAGLFLNIEYEAKIETGVRVPVVDPGKCDFCGRCAEVCAWHAIAVAGEKVLVFKDMCHGCGGCALACPRNAVTEELHVSGYLESGTSERVDFAGGILNTGQAMAVPIISSLLDRFLDDSQERTVILDAPPGTSCPVVETIRPANYVVLVTEPTPFGLHDLAAMVNVVRDQLGIPAGVVINRYGAGSDDVEGFCREKELPVLAKIPMDRRIAETLSEGVALTDGLPGYRPLFAELLERIRKETSS